MIRELDKKIITFLKISACTRTQALHYYEMEEYKDGIMLVEHATKNFFGTFITDVLLNVPLKITKKDERFIIKQLQNKMKGNE